MRDVQLTDMQMIMDPDNWPQWPFLLMRNRKITASDNLRRPRVGILTRDSTGYMFADEVNMFDADELSNANWKSIKVNELLNLGWEVD